MKYLFLIIIYLGIIMNSNGVDKWKLTEAVIIENPKASPELKLATQELQAYIKDITKHKIKIIDFKQAKHYPDKLKINIGINNNLKDIPDLSKCEYDGAWIKTLAGNNLLISGRTSIGTEFGIYAFLEEYCGVRWFLPGPDGTYIPHNSNLKIEKINKLSNPFFLSRTFGATTLFKDYQFPCAEATEMDRAWYRHNRMLMEKRFKCSHNLGKILIPSKYKKDHPEYFPVQADGKRFIPKTNRTAGWQPCMTNEDVIDICAKAAIKYFDDNPEEISFSIGVNDWGNYCHCPKCLEANGGKPKTNSRGLSDYSLLAFKFANKVAAKLSKKYKNKYVGMLAYSYQRDYPKDFKFHPNVMIQRTTAFICYFNPADRKDMKATLHFAKNSNMFSVYDYWYGNGYLIPNFPIGLMEEYIDLLAKNNTRGWTSEIYQNWSMDGIKYYLLARKLWNPQLRVSDLLNDYCEKMFDSGASSMLEFYKICQDVWENQTNTETTKYYLQNKVEQVRIFNVKTCDKLILSLKDALCKTQNTHGKALIAHKIKAITFTKNNAELVELAKLISENIGNAEKLKPLCLDNIKKLKEIECLRKAMSINAFSVPRMSLGKKLALKYPETISNPLYQACLKERNMTLWENYLKEVKNISQVFYQRARWCSLNIKQMEEQAELIANGDFNEGVPAIKNIPNWIVSDWGSKNVKSDIKLEVEKNEKICSVEGISYCFMYAPSPGVSQFIKVKPDTWYIVKCLIKSNSPWNSVGINTYIEPKGRFSCPIVAGKNWFPAVWLVKTPRKASKFRFRLSMVGVGKIWFDKVSMKEIPTKLAIGLHDNQLANIYPPLQKITKLPPAASINFKQPPPVGVNVIGQISDGIIRDSQNYNVLTSRHVFKGSYDMKIKIRASSPDGATLGLLALQYRANKVRMKNQTIGQFRTKLSKNIKEYEFLYRHNPECREALFIFYRSNRKGILKIEEIKLIPVIFGTQTSIPVQKPSKFSIDFTEKTPVGAHVLGQVSNGVMQDSKNYTVLKVNRSFKGHHDVKIKIEASSPDGATLGVLALQYNSNKVRLKNQTLGKFRTKLSKNMKEYEFLYKHDSECKRVLFLFYRSNRKGTLKIKKIN